jgi:hypothetical protein
MPSISQEDIVGVMLGADFLTEATVDRSVQVSHEESGWFYKTVTTFSHTTFPLAILEFPPESSGYSYFVPEEDLTYAGGHARLRISQGLKDKFLNPSRMILWPWYRHGIVCESSIGST